MLSAPILRTFKGSQDEIAGLLADSATYYKGAILVNSSGKAAKPSEVAENQAVLGILDGRFSDGDSVSSKEIGSSNTLKAVLKRGKVWLPHSGAVQTDVGKLFTPADDNSMVDVPATATKRYIGYMALEYDAGKGLLFDLRCPFVVDNET